MKNLMIIIVLFLFGCSQAKKDPSKVGSNQELSVQDSARKFAITGNENNQIGNPPTGGPSAHEAISFVIPANSRIDISLSMKKNDNINVPQVHPNFLLDVELDKQNHASVESMDPNDAARVGRFNMGLVVGITKHHVVIASNDLEIVYDNKIVKLVESELNKIGLNLHTGNDSREPYQEFIMKNVPLQRTLKISFKQGLIKRLD